MGAVPPLTLALDNRQILQARRPIPARASNIYNIVSQVCETATIGAVVQMNGMAGQIHALGANFALVAATGGCNDELPSTGLAGLPGQEVLDRQ